ncbi:MAG: hypothetical protein AABY22_34405, partial [Nanoarchaeota archaeon]
MKIQDITENTFWQLLTIYIILIIAIALGFLSRFALYFNIFALIISIFGISILSKEEKSEMKTWKKLHIILFILSIIFIILFRTIPYIGNDIPLGYDAGLYKYGIEYGLQNKDQWILSGMEPGFLYLTKPLSFIFSTDVLLKHIFILFIILLGFAIYVFSKEYFDSNTAILALLVYSLSLVQFEIFTYLYYKNIIALSLILFSFYFLKKEKYLLFVLTGILIGSIHRPSFYIFGLSYLFFAFTSPYKEQKYNFNNLKRNILSGIIILIGSSLFYIGDFKQAVLSMISPVLSSFIQTGESPGTFITFNVYQFSILFYLPFAFLGLFFLIKNKKFDILFFYTLILAVIVYFKFFF